MVSKLKSFGYPAPCCPCSKGQKNRGKTVYFNHLPLYGSAAAGSLFLVQSIGNGAGASGSPSCFVDSPCAVLCRLGLFVLRWDFPTRNPQHPALFTTHPKRGKHHVTQICRRHKRAKNKKVSTFLVWYDSKVS